MSHKNNLYNLIMNENKPKYPIKNTTGFGYRGSVEILFFVNSIYIFSLVFFIMYNFYYIHVISVILIFINFYYFKEKISIIKKLSNYNKVNASIDEIYIKRYIFGRENKYHPYIKYTFENKGVFYASDNFFIDNSYAFDLQKQCENFLDSIIQNGLTIYCCPDNPRLAYIFIDYNFKNKIYLYGFLLFSCFFILVIIYTFFGAK